MAETSGLWTTAGAPVGDQAVSYTQSLASTMLRIAAACSGFEGVAPGYLNELAPSSTGVNNCRIASGGAMVDGKYYSNSANVDFNIISAVGGGNTRIDRIVIKALWGATFTCRLTLVSGADAAVPVAPTLDTTSETDYDIPICQVLVTTGGVITITDERRWAIVDTDESTLEDNAGLLRVKALGITSAQLAADAVIAGKIADGAVDITASLANDIVDDTKVGNRVAQFYRRQGGSASDWSLGGTTTYTPTTIRTQWGVLAISGTTVLTFPTAFSDKPVVLVSFKHGTNEGFAYLTAVSATQITIECRDANGADVGGDAHWLAIGPE
jgi:hypothetical protein